VVKYNRHIAKKLLQAADDTPALIVVGARQVGKSTLLRDLLPICVDYVTLDDMSALSAARSDPDMFLTRYGTGTLVIDEAQLAPELLRTVKKVIDSDRRSGRFILSGSADVMSLPKLSESLAGRCEIFRMYPLARSEITGESGNFANLLFDNNPCFSDEKLNFCDLAEIMFVGGYPEILRRKITRISDWFRSYVTTIIQRDVREILNVSDPTTLRTVLGLLARRCGNLLNVSDISRLSGVKNTTLQRYMSVLETVFFVHRNGPWHKGIDAKLTKSPKVYMNDAGLLCYLAGVSRDDLIAKETPYTGAILENFVFNELQKQISWSDIDLQMYHFRTVTGREVDIVLEAGDGRKVALEVKAASNVSFSDFEGIREFECCTGGDLHAGVVLYIGDRVINFGKNLRALPMANIFR
jgi:predicted AAA+ superfamily ATPase